MKKILYVLLSALLVLTLFAGCGEAKPEQETDNTKGTTEQKTEAVFTFKLNGVEVPMDAPSADLVEKLGAYSYFEAPSCAFQGLDKTYTYGGFTLYTYEVDKVDHVLSVVLTDDSVTTPEGVMIGSSLADVKAAYGENFTVNGGAYVYTMGKSALSFIVENDAVTSIEYKVITEA